MKTLTYLCVTLLLACVVGACNRPKNNQTEDYYVFTSFHEPATEGLRFLYSKDGIHWDSIGGTWLKPTLGDSILRDPSIIVGKDSLFHLVWTIAWKGNTGFGYASSKDLKHWSEPKRIPAMDTVATTQNVWAPELFYDDLRDQYMIVYASCVVNKNFEVGVEDPKNNHRLYYVTTKDFETFSDPKLLYDPGFSCIDATLLKRGDKDYVMVLKDNTRPNRNLKIAFAKDPEGPYTAASSAFTENFVEGPSVEKVGDDYLIYFDVYRKGIYGAMKTRDFLNFTDVTDSVSVPKGHKHGTIFRAPSQVIKGLLDGSAK